MPFELVEYKFESEAQEKSFKSLIQFLKKESGKQDLPEIHPKWLGLVAAYFIQKEHESNEWWANTIGDQISKVHDQLHRQTKLIGELMKNVEKLEDKVL